MRACGRVPFGQVDTLRVRAVDEERSARRRRATRGRATVAHHYTLFAHATGTARPCARTTRRAVAEAGKVFQAGRRRVVPEPGHWPRFAGGNGPPVLPGTSQMCIAVVELHAEWVGSEGRAGLGFCGCSGEGLEVPA